MLFGRKELFAIEANLNQHFNSDYIFISYCYYIKNTMIGDITQNAVLTSEIEIFKNILNNKGKRRFDEFSKYSRNDIVAYLINKLWNSKSEEDIIRLPYVMNDLKILDINSYSGECFQGYFAFLLEFDSFDWLLCKESKTNAIYDLKIPKGFFYICIEQMLDWINNSTKLILRQ